MSTKRIAELEGEVKDLTDKLESIVVEVYTIRKKLASPEHKSAVYKIAVRAAITWLEENKVVNGQIHIDDLEEFLRKLSMCNSCKYKLDGKNGNGYQPHSADCPENK